MNGTATSYSKFAINKNFLPPGNYLISSGTDYPKLKVQIKKNGASQYPDGGIKPRNIIIDGTEELVEFYFDFGEGASPSNIIVYPMVRCAHETDDTYEPYRGTTLTLSTPNGLPGIPVTSGGNYIDSTGQQWICDSIDFANGKYVQNVKEVILNKSNFWGSFSETDTYKHFLFSTNIVYDSDGNYKSRYLPFLSNTFPKGDSVGKANLATIDNSGWAGKACIDVFADKTNTDIDTFVTNYPDFRIIAPLPNPIETDLTEEQLAAYAALHTNYPNTTVYNDAGADMEVKYYTPNTAVQMVHSPADEGKVLAIDEHGCVVLSNDIGGGTISIDLDGYVEGEATPVNADTLGGIPAEEYVKKSDAMVTKNYSVVGEMNIPENPTENMIWIQTNVIDDIFFNGFEPNNAKDNDVWIYTDNHGSNVAFDAIKIGNDTMNTVYPISAKQYVSGAWVDVTAKSYQGGEWVDWWQGELFDNGNKFEHITGGWVSGSWIFQSGDPSNGNVSIADTITLTSSTDGSCKSARTKNTINLKDFSKIKITGSCGGHMKSIIISESSDGVVPFNIEPLSSGTIEVDISGYNRSYYIGAVARNGGYVAISKIQLVR